MRSKFPSFSVSIILLVAGFIPAVLIIQSCSNRDASDTKPVQTLPMKQVVLDDLKDFESTGSNWQIAGAVQSNRSVEHDLKALEGKGIVVNIPDENNQEHLFTGWNHGDLELELDFLMPKGSNSGIYLMGRYEVQLFDSWGVENPKHSDAGGIYQRWDESRPEGERGFEGHAPRMNASRAPGLWQHLKIHFKAPAFNGEGEKISNAVFEEVWLNGVLVQENVEVTGPTRAAPFDDEQPTGPLMIQGDHGPVAIKDITYKRYDKNRIGLTDLEYDYYADAFEQLPDFNTLDAGSSGTVDSLSGSLEESDDRYALRYTGTLNAPNKGDYLFKLQNAGSVRMLIDDKVIFSQDRPYRMHELETKIVELEPGAHDFVLEYIDHPNNWYGGLALHAEGPRLRLQKLHASSSVPGGGRELPDLIVGVEDRVKVLRSFAMHRGVKRTHVVNVGAPSGINYSYDLGQAAILQAWEGPFVNANNMWINRGEPQLANPAGPPVTFMGKPSLARLDNNNAAWPDSVEWDMLNVNGYTITDSGWPVFKYTIDNISIEDRIEGSAEKRHLIRTITFKAPQTKENVWFQLASGKEIQQTGDEYVVDQRSYYLKLDDTQETKPDLVSTSNGMDLRIPVLAKGTEAEVKYEIIW